VKSIIRHLSVFNNVAQMLTHPDSLADPELLDRALAANKRLAADGGGAPLDLS
jgi:hypothetical protein